MSTPLTTLPGIGPALAGSLTAIGITDAETFRALGADAAYVRLVAAGERPHFIPYYVLHMALQGRPWNDCKGEEKVALRRRFDALMTTARDSGLPPKLAQELDRLGLRAPSRT